MPKAFAAHTILVIEVIESHFECYAAARREAATDRLHNTFDMLG